MRHTNDNFHTQISTSPGKKFLLVLVLVGALYARYADLSFATPFTSASASASAASGLLGKPLLAVTGESETQNYHEDGHIAANRQKGADGYGCNEERSKMLSRSDGGVRRRSSDGGRLSV